MEVQAKADNYNIEQSDPSVYGDLSKLLVAPCPKSHTGFSGPSGTMVALPKWLRYSTRMNSACWLRILHPRTSGTYSAASEAES